MSGILILYRGKMVVEEKERWGVGKVLPKTTATKTSYSIIGHQKLLLFFN